MSFMRDKDARTRGVGAVAALDHVSAAGRRAQRARAIAMARRDAALARTAMGAISTGYRESSPTGMTSSVSFDTGRAPAPASPTGGGIGPAPAPITQRFMPTATKLSTQSLSQSIDPFRPATTSPTAPPPLPPPPPVVVVDTPPPAPSTRPAASPVSSSSSGGGGGGGGGGGSWSPTPPRHPAVISEEMPDIVEPLPSSPSSGAISGKTLAIGAGILLGAYFLFKKKA